MSKLFLRMESETNDDMPVQDMLAVEDEARMDAEEVTAAAADVTELDTGIDNANEAADTVADVEAIVEESVAEGEGLTPREAELVEARLEHAAKLLGADLADMGLTFRRESFGGKDSRLAVTKMRLESIKEFGKKIWEAIKKAWLWLKTAVKDLYGKITKSGDSLIARYKTLETRVNEIKGKPKQDKLKAGAKLFSINGVTNLNTMYNYVDLLGGYNAVLQDLASFAMEGATNSNPPGDLGKTVVTKVFTKEVSISAKSLKSESSVKALVRLPGGNGLVCRDSTETSGDTSIPVAKLSVEMIDEKMAEEYMALSQDDLKALVARGMLLAKASKMLSASAGVVEKAIDANVKYVDAMVAAGSKITAMTDETKAKKAKEDLDAHRVAMRHNQNAFRLLCTRIPQAVWTVTDGLADVISANVSNFKEEK